MDKLFFIDKPIGYTSRKICNMIQKAYQSKKVGHIGTLDPFASGLLIVAINKATKAVTFFDESIKEYVAIVKLGIETDTLDNTGKITNRCEIIEYSEEDIKEVLTSFLGPQKQLPPMTSAIHVNGKRLYEYAHKGEEISRPLRDVYIYDLKLLSYDKINGEINIYAKVSKGTYIRTLGSDIATKLKTIGHLSSLRRISVSPFDISLASSLEDVLQKRVKGYDVSEILSKIMEVLLISDSNKIEDIKNGKITYLNYNTKEYRILVVDSLNNAVAVYQKDESNKLKFVRGLF